MGEIDVIPYTDIAPVHARNPVPADRGVERRVVRSQDTAVVGIALKRVSLAAGRIIVLVDEDFDFVGSGPDYFRDIETAAFECSLDASEAFSVHPYVGFPVDAVKVEEGVS